MLLRVDPTTKDVEKLTTNDVKKIQQLQDHEHQQDQLRSCEANSDVER